MNVFVATLLLAFVQEDTKSPALAVQPSTQNISIGERFQLTATGTGPRGTSWSFPKHLADGSTEITLSPNSAAAPNIATYDAQVFAVGKAVLLPEIRAAYTLPDGTTGEAASAPSRINLIPTVDPSDTNPTPSDFAPPQPVLASRAYWIANGAAVLLLLVGLFFLVRRLRLPRKPLDPTVVPAITPEEQALTSLELLVARRATLEPRDFYIQLTQVLKQYLEIRLEAPILEMTSTETLTFAKGHEWTTNHAVALRDLVSAADLVKFGGSSDASNADRQIQFVRELVGRIDALRRAALTPPAVRPREREPRRVA